MLNGKKVFAIIPARGGSKGIPRKNLYRLGKYSLLEGAINLGKGCRYVDRVYVSTDDPEMWEISKKYGAHTRELRPAELATDTAKTIDVLNHLIPELSMDDSYVLLLQPTSPLRTTEDANKVCGLLEGRLDQAVVSLTELTHPHPYKAQVLEGGYVRSLLGVESTVPRQTLPKVYVPNGAFYLTHVEAIVEQGTLMPERTLPYVMPPITSVNLDGPLDVVLLEALLAKGMVRIDDGENVVLEVR